MVPRLRGVPRFRRRESFSPCPIRWWYTSVSTVTTGPVSANKPIALRGPIWWLRVTVAELRHYQPSPGRNQDGRTPLPPANSSRRVNNDVWNTRFASFKLGRKCTPTTYPEIDFSAVVFNQVIFADADVKSLAEAVRRSKNPTGADQSTATKGFLKTLHRIDQIEVTVMEVGIWISYLILSVSIMVTL